MKQILKTILILFLCFFCTSPGLTAVTCSTLNLAYTFTSGTAADASQVNSNFSSGQTAINNACTDITAFDTSKANLTANTFTGIQTFNAGIAFESGDGINDVLLILDADNAGAEVDQSLRFNRGSTDANDARISWIAADDRYVLTTDGTTLADVKVGEGDSSDEIVTYDQVVLDTGTQTVAGAKTWSDAAVFSSTASFAGAVTLTTTCSTANHACPKTYIDTADSAITAGGSSEGSGAPAGACTNGAKYYDVATNTSPIEYYCKGSDSMTWVKNDLDSVDTTNPIITSTDVDLTGVPPSSATDSLLGLGIDIASGSANGNFIGINKATFTGNLIQAEVAGVDKFVVDSTGAVTVAGTISGVTDPTTAQQAATKNYVDNGVRFAPPFIDSNTVWLDANTLSATLTDGASVTSWTDASGTLEAFAEATNPPTFKTSIINSRPVVRFDGTNDLLTSTSQLSTFLAVGAKTVFLVVKTPSAFQSGDTLCGIMNSVPYVTGGPSANCRLGIHVLNTGVLNTVNYDGSQDVLTGDTLSASTTYVLTYQHDGTNQTSQVNAATADSGASGNSDSLADTLLLGNYSTVFAEVDIAELIMYNTVLTTAQKARVREYLRSKYAIY